MYISTLDSLFHKKQNSKKLTLIPCSTTNSTPNKLPHSLFSTSSLSLLSHKRQKKENTKGDWRSHPLGRTIHYSPITHNSSSLSPKTLTISSPQDPSVKPSHHKTLSRHHHHHHSNRRLRQPYNLRDLRQQTLRSTINHLHHLTVTNPRFFLPLQQPTKPLPSPPSLITIHNPSLRSPPLKPIFQPTTHHRVSFHRNNTNPRSSKRTRQTFFQVWHVWSVIDLVLSGFTAISIRDALSLCVRFVSPVSRNLCTFDKVATFFGLFDVVGSYWFLYQLDLEYKNNNNVPQLQQQTTTTNANTMKTRSNIHSDITHQQFVAAKGHVSVTASSSFQSICWFCAVMTISFLFWLNLRLKLDCWLCLCILGYFNFVCVHTDLWVWIECLPECVFKM